MAFFDFLKREAPGFADAYIVDMPPQLGIRETRRIAGLYQLTGDDVLSCASFPDTIGVNGWPIEAHVAGDVVWQWPEAGSRGFNHLPYRMLVPPGMRKEVVVEIAVRDRPPSTRQMPLVTAWRRPERARRVRPASAASAGFP